MSKQKTAELRKSVSPFEKSDINKSIKQLINTFVPFFGLWYLAYASLSISYWLTLPLAIVASGFVIRIFIIFHDCCHQSFFKNRKLNALIGNISGIITMFPYEQWKRSHNIHHATSGNLDKRGIGDIWVMTVEEYLAATPAKRLQYRMYRNPFVMFVLGPIFLFLITNRINVKDAKRKERLNTYFNNVAIVVLYAFMIWLVGWKAFVLVQAPILFVAGALGIWLFYVQHQYEDSYFEHEEEWNYVKAAVEGSSYYKLPKVLQWVTGNIGFHHVHHLAPKVPNYNLEQAHVSTPPLQKATTITLGTSLESIHFKLFDEENKRFVTFKHIQHLLEEGKASLQLGSKRPTLEEK
jgi:acyl-lipid omega-6 desaturase (Delta-12 desaturase)